MMTCMLRNPFSGDLSTRGGGESGLPVPPLESAHELSPFSWVCMKKHSVNSLPRSHIHVIAITNANISYKIVLDLGNSLYIFKARTPFKKPWMYRVPSKPLYTSSQNGKFTFSLADASVDFMVVPFADPGIFASGEVGGGGLMTFF